MKVTRIDRCANHECPNRACEGTMTVTTINTREGRPRNITLVLCGPCSDYLEEAKQDAIKLAVVASHRPVAPSKTYTLIGGPAHGQRHVIPQGHREWRIARRIDPSYFTSPHQESYTPVPIAYDTYVRAYYRGHGSRVAYIHTDELRDSTVWVSA